MTDADVDGSHIRTLILTFFFKYMKDIIKAGHLYVAQPPLFKVKKGKSEVYLKDEESLDNFLIESSIENLTLKYGTKKEGLILKGTALLEVIKAAYYKTKILKSISSGSEISILQALAICGGMTENITKNEKKLESLCVDAAKNLNNNKDDDEKWQLKISMNDRKIIAVQEKNEVEKTFKIDFDLLESSDALRLHKSITEVKDLYEEQPLLMIGDREINIKGPLELFETIYFTTRKSYSIQRYKGLGEMNPGQLWETTLDPDARNLLRVQYKDEWAADELFSKLMGSNVEPRRNFIQKYALEVENIDT